MPRKTAAPKLTDDARRRAGLEAIAEWEKEHGAFTEEEMKESRRRVREQLRASQAIWRR